MVSVTYPGVYVEEISSGVRTIMGVSTSTTAFIGRALRGPVEEPVIINGFGDFERLFGGLWKDSTLGHSVRDFFQNGGSKAIIVRLYSPSGSTKDKASFTIGDLKIEARSEGSWGNDLRVRIDQNGISESDKFNLYVKDLKTGRVETFYDLSKTKNDPRFCKNVLERSSEMVRSLNDNDLTTVPNNDEAANPEDIFVADSANKYSNGVTEISSDGKNLDKNNLTPASGEANKKGIFSLEKADIFNLLCVPPFDPESPACQDSDCLSALGAYCLRKRAFLIVDPPSSWTSRSEAIKNKDAIFTPFGNSKKNAAVFYPLLKQRDPTRSGDNRAFSLCGTVAGIFARTDSERGVWKAPAGMDASISGAVDLNEKLTDREIGDLNPLGINCLRYMPGSGMVVWGARTLDGNDRSASEWKYIPIRRTALFIEESLYRATQWVVFEPNDEPLWAQIRLNVGAFMNNLFRQGAFQGKTPKEAYFVKCDSETTPQNDIDQGRVNIIVGFAPLKPAEFVVIKLQQMAGQIQT